MKNTLSQATPFKKILDIRRIYLAHPNGISDNEMIELACVSRATVHRWREQLDAYNLGNGRYRVDPDDDDLRFADTVYQRRYGQTLEDRAKKNGHT